MIAVFSFAMRYLALACLTCLGACAAPVEPQKAIADRTDTGNTPGGNFFDRQEAALRANGRMKVDRLAAGVAFDANDLSRNFERVAFGAEFTIENGVYHALVDPGEAVLRRWDDPVLYHLSGEHTPSDHAAIARFADRLSAGTGLEIRAARRGEPSNLEIAFQGKATRDSLTARYRNARRDLPLADLYLAWADAPTWPCAGEFYFPRETEERANQIDLAVIYIRDEVRGLSRQSCIEEEFAQILGLGRDDASVRPSIFNDDEEFALLTRHDTLLLRILYDWRLRPGMSPAAAMPIVHRIARELVPDTGPVN